MNEFTKKTIAAIRHASELADALERGEKIQSYVDGAWWDKDAIYPESLLFELANNHRIKPAKKYRQWAPKEVPRHFIYRRKSSGSTLHVHDKARVERDDCANMFEFLIRILEDGTEVPCGVEVVE